MRNNRRVVVCAKRMEIMGKYGNLVFGKADVELQDIGASLQPCLHCFHAILGRQPRCSPVSDN